MDPLPPALRPGLERSSRFEVGPHMLTDVGGTLSVSVISTPAMVASMERNAMELAAEHLPAGQASVGFEVCVRHLAPAIEGARCVAWARLREVADGRKLRFDIELRALDGADPRGRLIGVGTHERRVVDVASHSARAHGRP